MPAFAGAALNEVAYHVLIDGRDVSSKFLPYLINLSINDRDGALSDTASIVLDDSAGQVLLAPEGARIVIGLGGVPDLFTGMVDTVKWQISRGSGATLAVTAKGIDERSSIRSPVEKNFDEMDLGGVMKAVGALGGLARVVIHPDISSIQRAYWAMDGESPLAFGRRISREVGATFKIVNGDTAVMVPRSSGLSANGKALTGIRAAIGENLISADIAPYVGRPQARCVKSKWYDLAAARFFTQIVPIANTIGVAEHLLGVWRSSAGEAGSQATSEARERERAKGGGSVTIVGNARAQPGATCDVLARPGVSGRYTIDGATHMLDRSQGFITRLDLVRPDGEAGKDSR